MGIVLSWVSENWFSLLQTVGILCGLLYNAHLLLLNSRIRTVDTLFNMTQQHRAIWFKYFRLPRLHRILNPHPDLAHHPITDDEAMFVNLIILHLTTVLTAVEKKIFPKPAGLNTDVQEFFLLPIPNAVWQKTKEFREAKTIEYVESLSCKKLKFKKVRKEKIISPRKSGEMTLP